LGLARQVLDQRERLLKLALAALERSQLVALGSQYAKELLDLHLLRDGDTAKLLDVGLAPKVHGAIQ
jgi:hypothetical protein